MPSIIQLGEPRAQVHESCECDSPLAFILSRRVNVEPLGTHDRSRTITNGPDTRERISRGTASPQEASGARRKPCYLLCMRKHDNTNAIVDAPPLPKITKAEAMRQMKAQMEAPQGPETSQSSPYFLK